MGSSRKQIMAVVGAVIIVLIIFGLFSTMSPQPPAKPVETVKETDPKYSVIGTSVEGRKIESFTYGTGPTHLGFVGGIHGGYEWNSVLLAYEFVDYLKANPTVVPANLTITIIPSANPDAVFKVTNKEGWFVAADVATDKTLLAQARFNANAVDLNRNFDCKWQPKSTWRTQTVSAGTAAFSEPEAAAIRDFVLAKKPAAMIFWHSQANAVYASECDAGILPETLAIMNAYATAAKYQAVKTFDAYTITGDAEGWLASINIPAITVELSTHQTIEWEKNLAGMKAVIEYYSQQ